MNRLIYFAGRTQGIVERKKGVGRVGGITLLRLATEGRNINHTSMGVVTLRHPYQRHCSRWPAPM